MADYSVLIANNSNGVLADISGYAYDLSVGPRLSRPSESSFRVALTPEVLAMSGGDGFPLFWPGLRRIIVIRNGACVANDILWAVQPKGGPEDAFLEALGFGPMIRWQTRWCQDENGQIFDGPSITNPADHGLDLPAGIIADPDMEVVAAQMLKQAIDNTISIDGSLGCTTDGDFSTTPTPGGNVAFSMRNLSPLRLGDLATLFEQTGVCDIVITPTNAGGDSQGSVSAVNRAGVDLPGVQFNYGTGASSNVVWAYPEASMDDFCNKLWYELGRREGSHFANNVTADAPGVTTDDSASRSAYGVYHDIILKNEFSGRILNTSNLFKMYVRLYNAELAARMAPRQMIKLVPQAGLAPEPWTHFNLGDTPRANLANLGLPDVGDANFRIVGWDAKPSNDNEEHVELQIGWSPS